MNHGQYRINAKLVEMIHQDFQGFHPGYRDVHASGRYYLGTFTLLPRPGNLAAPYTCRVTRAGYSSPLEQRIGQSVGASNYGVHGCKVLSA